MVASHRSGASRQIVLPTKKDFALEHALWLVFDSGSKRGSRDLILSE